MRRTAVFFGVVLVVLLLGNRFAQADGGLHGRVLGRHSDSSQTEPISGAKIRLLDAGGAAVAEVTTGPGGYYQADLSPGSYRYEISADGYHPERGTRGIVVRSPHRRAVYNITLLEEEDSPGDHSDGRSDSQSKSKTIPAGTLYGQVFYRDSDGQRVGIPNATVQFGGPGKLLLLSFVDTTAGRPGREKLAGNYTVKLAAGSYRLGAKADGFSLKESAPRVDVIADQPNEYDLEMVANEAEELSQGIDVFVRCVSSAVNQTTVTVPDDLRVGAIALDAEALSIMMSPQSRQRWSADLAPGRYRVIGKASGFGQRSSGLIHVLDGQRSRVDLTLSKAESSAPPAVTPPPGKNTPAPLDLAQGIRGTISFAPEDGGSSAASLQMTNVELRIGSLPAGTLRKLSPDALGNFEVGLQPGSYRIVATAPGLKAAGEAVRVVGGQYATVNLVLGSAGSADRPDQNPMPKFTPDTRPGEPLPKSKESGKLAVQLNVQVWSPLDAQQRRYSIDNAMVSLRRGERTVASGQTNSRGSVQLSVPPGGYELATVARGFQPELSTVRLSKPMTSTRVYLSRDSGDTNRPDRPSEPGALAKPTPTMPVSPDLPKSTGLTRVNIQVGYKPSTTTGLVRVLSGATIEFQFSSRGVQTLVTGPDGVASTDLLPARYQLKVSKAGFQTQTQLLIVGQKIVNHRILLVPEGGTAKPMPPGTGSPNPPPITRPIQPMFTVQVGGVSQSTGNQVRLLPDAIVTVRKLGKEQVSGRTDSRGVYKTQLTPGVYQLDVQASGYAPKSERVVIGQTSISQRILLRALTMGQVTPPLTPTPMPTDRIPLPKTPELQLIPGAKLAQPTIAIQVGGKDVGGSNQVSLVRNANVFIMFNGQVRANGKTDSSGVFRTALPKGNYQIRVTHPDHYDQSMTVAHKAVSTTSRMLLEPRRKIE